MTVQLAHTNRKEGRRENCNQRKKSGSKRNEPARKQHSIHEGVLDLVIRRSERTKPKKVDS